MSELKTGVAHSVSEINESQWDNVVRQSITGGRRDLSDYWEAIEQGNRGEPVIFTAVKKGNLVGFLAGNVVDLPMGQKFLSSSTPVVTSSEEKVLESIFDELEEYCDNRNIVYHEMRESNLSNVRFQGFLSENGYSSSIFSSQHKLGLDRDMETLIGEMSNSRRKKFQQMMDGENVEVVKPSREELVDFYEGTKKYQRRAEVPVLGIDFFVKLADVEDIEIMKFVKDGEIVAQNLYLLEREDSQVHYLLSSVNEDYKQHNALEAIHAYAISRYHGDFGTYNFGDNQADFRDGIFGFKQQYGCKVEPLIKWKRVFPSVKNKAYLSAINRLRGLNK